MSAVARRLLVPDAVMPDVTAITAERLRAHGLTGLIVDLDNTLTHWNDARCDEGVAAWVRQMRDEGFVLCIVSNNGPERVSRFCEGLGVDLPWIAHAGKPSRRAYRRALAMLGRDPEQVAVIGDQVFTDVLGGNRAGLRTILVRPRGRREFIPTRIVRIVERLWLQRLNGRGTVTPL
jgi:hypothetical protein